jgi:N-acetylglucosamine malate deacetylase 1
VRAATGFWSGVGWAAGRLAGWRPATWQSPGGQRVLVVAPHPDDEVGCGGTLLLHGLAGDTVHVAYVTDGRASGAGGLGPDQMAARRRQEVAAVAPVLGLAGAHWLGLREREWDESALVPALRDLLLQTAPDILYAPSCVDFHPEHVRVARCLAQASAGLRDLRIRVYQIQVPLTPVLVNLVAPIESVAGQLLRAMRCYATQFGSIERCLRMKRYGGSFYGLGGPAEELWQIDANAYGRLHARDSGANTAFRGLPARPFTDPFSYAQGLGARVRLRALSLAG